MPIEAFASRGLFSIERANQRSAITLILYNGAHQTTETFARSDVTAKRDDVTAKNSFVTFQRRFLLCTFRLSLNTRTLTLFNKTSQSLTVESTFILYL